MIGPLVLYVAAIVGAGLVLVSSHHDQRGRFAGAWVGAGRFGLFCLISARQHDPLGMITCGFGGAVLLRSAALRVGLPRWRPRGER